MQWFISLGAPLQALLASLFLILTTALGASFVFFSKKANGTFLTVLTGTSAGIMLAASFFSLLLPALEYESSLPVWLTATLGLFLGGAFLVCSDVALSSTAFLRAQKEGKKRSALLFLAVTLHNIPEGMAVGVSYAQGAMGITSALLLTLGIGIQNIPEGTCIAFPLRAQGQSRRKSFLFSLLSGMVEIPACVLGAVAATFVVGLMPWALAFSAGAMIAVVCSELIPDCFQTHKTVASASVMLGFCLMMVLDLALG
ncbi:MAG: ZIP family metal transporter [Clostridia bacterium]|nr:ZIP family metal transporter [Clostridia bacterium]